MNNKLESINIRDDVTILVGPPQNLIQTAVQHTVSVWGTPINNLPQNSIPNVVKNILRVEGTPINKLPTNKNYNSAIRNLNGALSTNEGSDETNPNGLGRSGSSSSLKK